MENHTNRQAKSVILSVLDTHTMTFGSRLKAWRKAKGWTQEELANAADLSFPYISNLERDFSTTSKSGKVKPSERTCEKLSRALGAPLDEVRRAAGYSSSSAEDAHDILDIATVMFHDAERLTPEEKEELLAIVRRVAAGMIRRD